MSPTEVLLVSRARRFAASGEGQRRRLTANLSLREFATAIGVSHTALAKWETGVQAPRGPQAVAGAEFVLDLERAQGGGVAS